MTLNEYLMYEGRHRDLERKCEPARRELPKENRVGISYLIQEDEENCWLPPFHPCFKTPQPCTIFNSIHHNSRKEVDIDSMTLDEYDLYMAMQCSKKSDDVDNINYITTSEKKEVHDEEVEMDENHDVDHSNIKEAL
ncbi:hypothetical protein Tco_0826896 [Tanacetum coccineum]